MELITDCVMMAVGIYWAPTFTYYSGLNAGANLGDDVTYPHG
jgi:broad specificity polyphosphatase/5'/3'-nucleotidase SurE